MVCVDVSGNLSLRIDGSKIRRCAETAHFAQPNTHRKQLQTMTPTVKGSTDEQT